MMLRNKLSRCAYLCCSKDNNLQTYLESFDRNVGVSNDKYNSRIEDIGKRSVKGKGPDIGSGSSKPSVIDSANLLQAIPNEKRGWIKDSRRRETQEPVKKFP